jgi:hypothetical protein
MGPLLIRSLGRIDFYFTTGLPLMPLYYIIEKDTDKTNLENDWDDTGTQTNCLLFEKLCFDSPRFLKKQFSNQREAMWGGEGH